jgi:hypothetical protein
MPTTAILGLQWGDEGKGKLVDSISAGQDLCVRFQGGGNAGHTVYPDGKKIVLHHLPTGVLHPSCINIMGQGMVMDPGRVLDEIAEVEARNLKLDGRLFISDRIAVTIPLHLTLDSDREQGAERVGTTKRGIGPTYADRYDRVGIRAADLLDKTSLKEALERAVHVADCKTPGAPTVETMLKPLLESGKKLKPYITDTSLLLAEAVKENKSILFEGAQGAMLDVVQGTYPFVTSSHTTGAGIGAGCGLAITAERAIGVTKAYCTRVGLDRPRGVALRVQDFGYHGTGDHQARCPVQLRQAASRRRIRRPRWPGPARRHPQIQRAQAQVQDAARLEGRHQQSKGRRRPARHGAQLPAVPRRIRRSPNRNHQRRPRTRSQLLHQGRPEGLVVLEQPRRVFVPGRRLVAGWFGSPSILGLRPYGDDKSVFAPSNTVHFLKCRQRLKHGTPRSRPFRWQPRHVSIVKNQVLRSFAHSGDKRALTRRELGVSPILLFCSSP